MLSNFETWSVLYDIHAMEYINYKSIHTLCILKYTQWSPYNLNH